MNENEAIRTMTQSINFVYFLRYSAMCTVSYVHIYIYVDWWVLLQLTLIWFIAFNLAKWFGRKQYKWTVSKTAVDRSHGHDLKRETVCGGNHDEIVDAIKRKQLISLSAHNFSPFVNLQLARILCAVVPMVQILSL